MDGPINFGQNDNNWGLLVEGFMQQGFGMPYIKSITGIFLKSMASENILNNILITGRSGEKNKEIVQFPEQDDENCKLDLKEAGLYIPSF